MLGPIRHIDPKSLTGEKALREAILTLLNIVEEQASLIGQLRQENQELRDENNRLKGEQGRPKFTKAKPAPRDISSEKRRGKKNHKKGSKRSKLEIDRTEVCCIDRSALPQDAQFKGFDEVVQQNLRLVRENTLYRLECFYSPGEGKTYRALLPQDYRGAFGADLQSLLHCLHHVCDVTQGRLHVFLQSHGTFISSGTISNLLLKGEPWALGEQRDILRAGIAHGPYTQIDSTASKEKGERKATQVIGGDCFSVFFTLPSKSRLEILHALQGRPGTGLLGVLNGESRSLLGYFGVAKADRQFLETHFGGGAARPLKYFESYMQAHAPHIRAKKNMFPRILESLALGHYHRQTDFPVVDWLLSDDAGEYKKVGRTRQALCWVHDARYYNKLGPRLDIHRNALDAFQGSYWQFYGRLLDFKGHAPPQQVELKNQLSQQFDTLFGTTTDYAQLNACIERTRSNKGKLLAVLDNPALPLHNNAAELGARRVVRKRDISLHTWSEKGTRVRDAFMSIVETATKLGVPAMDYITDRITQKYEMPHLAALVRDAYA